MAAHIEEGELCTHKILTFAAGADLTYPLKSRQIEPLFILLLTVSPHKEACAFHI
jgi:hypothetical protein